MPERPLADLRELVGTTTRTVDGLRVAAGKVAEFARAVGDPADAYRDPDGPRYAPPTFTAVAAFPRHRPPGVGAEGGFDLGFDRARVLHGQQRYECVRPLRVGDVLDGETTLVDVAEREGAAGGTMTLATLRTDFRDGDGVVQRAWTTRIETAAAATAERSAPDPEMADAGAGARGAAGDPLAAGAAGPTVEFGPLEREQFVRYAGASGDFNPVHYDEPYATGAGHPSVFAQGMLTAGVATRLLRTWVGVPALETYRARFVAPAFPGETLVARGRVAAVDDAADGGRRVELDVEVAADDRQVMRGEATATVED